MLPVEPNWKSAAHEALLPRVALVISRAYCAVSPLAMFSTVISIDWSAGCGVAHDIALEMYGNDPAAKLVVPTAAPDEIASGVTSSAQPGPGPSCQADP